jgi:alkanesulfonate monooxygenase SsuD/methylene tetrahydromethanopterin reductase-like flavin-dependent oxidoreductase (luciferase family)
MRLGVAVMYWPWLTFEEQLAIAVLADELGFDSVWASEAWGQEAVATLAFIAARTEQIALGAAILQMPARKPTTTAMAATTIDVMSGGRMRIGLGPSGPQVSEVLLDPLLNGLAKSGRPREAFDVAAMVPVAIDEDLDAARDSVRPYIAFYLGAMGAKGANFYVDVAERYGIGDAANTIQDAWLAGDQAGAAAAVPDAMLERICLAATPATLGDRLGEFAAAGVDTLIAVPAGDRLRVVRALGAHVSGAGSA